MQNRKMGYVEQRAHVCRCTFDVFHFHAACQLRVCLCYTLPTVPHSYHQQAWMLTPDLGCCIWSFGSCAIACRFRGRCDHAKLVICMMSSVHMCDAAPMLCFVCACRVSAVSRLPLLLLNLFHREGWSPLHKASTSGHLEISRFLVGVRADVNIRDG